MTTKEPTMKISFRKPLKCNKFQINQNDSVSSPMLTIKSHFLWFQFSTLFALKSNLWCCHALDMFCFSAVCEFNVRWNLTAKIKFHTAPKEMFLIPWKSSPEAMKASTYQSLVSENEKSLMGNKSFSLNSYLHLHASLRKFINFSFAWHKLFYSLSSLFVWPR